MKNVRMNIDLSRHIDCWVGKPLCWFLTSMDFILKIFTPGEKKEVIPRKVLFIKLSEMGGIILSCPLIRRIKNEYPEAELFFLTFESNACLFSVLGIIPEKNVLTIRDQSFFLFMGDVFKVVIQMQKMKIDLAFDLEFFSRFSAIIAYLSGSVKRIGFHRYSQEGLYRGDLLTHKVLYNPHMHISKVFFSLGQTVKLSKKETPEFEYACDKDEMSLPDFKPTENQKENLRKKLEDWGGAKDSKLLLINPGDGWIPLREWSLDNFIAVAQKFLESSNHYIAVVGISEYSQKAKIFCKKMGNNHRCINLSNKTSLGELLTLYTYADVLLTNDSGQAHLASLTEIQQVVLFGPETPNIFSPLGKNVHIFYSNFPCSPCVSVFNHRKSTCVSNNCLKAFSFQDVYDVIVKKISF